MQSVFAAEGSGRPIPGPIAPLDWMAKAVLRFTRTAPAKKFLLVVGFQGTRFRKGARRGGNSGIVEDVSGLDFVSLLEEHKPRIEWDSRAREHVAVFKAADLDGGQNNQKASNDATITSSSSKQAETGADGSKGAKSMLNVVNYPSLRSISERVRLAAELGVGVTVWDVGQGLSYFFDLL
jgi:chitinase domain-containing protein 1